jgi:glutamine amidotransferase
MIAIIDYGMSNLRSVQKALEKAGYPASIVSTPEALRKARGLVFPGQGAFGDTMNNLRAQELTGAIKEAIADGKPFLGVCLGLQVLFDSSEEMGSHPGLGILPGRVRRFTGVLKVPHMGWNQVDLRQGTDNPLFQGISDHSYFYFVHSYYVETDDEAIIGGTTDYGGAFTSMVARGNLFGVQFHPEKSSDTGQRVYANFGKLVAAC